MASSTKVFKPAVFTEDALPSLRLARSSRTARRIGKFLFVFLIVSVVVAALAPWQQSVKGSGSVIAYSPQNREQTIESPIKGRIVAWGEGIYENAFVKKGDLIAEVADIDDNYLNRLEGQLTAAKSQLQAAETLLEANRRNRDAAETIVHAFEAQLNAYTQVKSQIVAAADATVESARDKVLAEEQQLAEHKAALAQVEADYNRQKLLYEDDIVSELKFQEAERKLRETQAKVSKSMAYVSAAKNELVSKSNERNAKEQKASADIEYANAALRKAIGDVAKAESEVAKAQSDVNKSEKDLLETETKVARQQSQQIRAEFDGYVTRIIPNQSTKILKEGTPICTMVPETDERAVQIWLDGNDAPLVEPGRHIRLQFEGWPAVQFAGWPSVAVGTFGGVVVSVDAIDDGKGKFRTLVLPDESVQEWPNRRFLRQGVRANGWVLLDEVPLWYEIWRNMNGFPPVVSTEEPKGAKPPKLPKP